ncbi:MAG TPA: FAD-dependent oxidoreductase, partial [Terrimicrobiaceae bacterium]|nr:FAD-dependent oxidoreductase [Terrimicrobiaceae bacterium]
EVRELLGGLRPGQAPAALVASPATTLPVLGEYDVVVVGGGTGGAPAGIAAAREGVSTLVLEYQYSLGGVGTVGRISKYWWGYKKGFPESMPDAKGYWDPRARAEWLRREILQPGGNVWFGVLGSGALVEGNRVKGVVVTTPLGRGVVLAKEVIDATGNSDIAAAAGAETIIPGDGQIAVQGTGLPAIRWGGRDFFNSDFTLVDENDMIDVWQMQLYTRLKYPNVFDTATFIDSRERRRIVGEFTQSVLDQVNDRTYPDTINMAYSNLDAHTFSVHPYLETEHPGKTVGITARIPYRCLIPKGLEGILVTGLSMSVEHDALAIARMQANIQNQGFAIGLAAATAAREGKGVRDIDIRALQKRLVELGSLPPETLTEVDSYPLSRAKLEEAVRTLPDHYKGASFLFAQPQDAIPLLQAAFASAPDPQTKLVYAHVLGLLGDATGAPALMEFVAANPWDKGWNYKALGNFGATLSRMDSYIMTLGRLGYRPAIPVIEKKASELTPASDFSHFRAIALALEDFGQPSSAPVLAALLSAPGMSGHEHADMKEILSDIKPSPSDNSTRAASLRELFLARALYLCGDENGLGQKILRNYSQDMRGHWVRFATDALKEKPQAAAGSQP